MIWHWSKCQSSAAKRWLDARQADLSPVENCHVVFTLPTRIACIAYLNEAVIYGLLFERGVTFRWNDYRVKDGTRGGALGNAPG